MGKGYQAYKVGVTILGIIAAITVASALLMAVNLVFDFTTSNAFGVLALTGNAVVWLIIFGVFKLIQSACERSIQTQRYEDAKAANTLFDPNVR